VAAQFVGSLFLGTAQTLGAVAALAAGLLAGAVVNLVAGSPGGLPTLGRVRQALDDIGVQVDDLRPARFTPEGVALLTGTHLGEPVQVKVYGRDAWEGELIASLWRLAWYRGGRRRVRLRRGEYVEHEGFATFLAGAAGLTVPEVVTAGRADNGDAIIVTRRNGATVDPGRPELTDEQVRALWSDLARLHAAGIVHHRIDLDRVATVGDTGAGFDDLSTADARRRGDEVLADDAQLLALTVLTLGPDRAVELAVETPGEDRLREVLPYLQDAAVPPLVRAGLLRRSIDLDVVRRHLAMRLDIEEPELASVRRVTPKTLIGLALLSVAAYTLIGMLGGIDLEAFGRDLADADRWWIVAALAIGQLPRVANAVSTMGSSMQPLPFGPTVALHFATCYVNLAVPSSAGRVAITTRFFQRFGVPPVTAVSAGVIDSVSELLVQLGLFVVVLLASDVDLGLSLRTEQLEGLATVALIVVGVGIVVGLVAIAIPSLRQRVSAWFGDARAALRVLRTPRRLLGLFGGNLLSQVLFAVALSACVQAFGYDVPLSSLILINTIVSLFAGVLPVPGGVGVSEAGISLGLTRAGLPAETALAVALTYRFCTFYLPPIWGLASYRWLIRHRYL
jgi:uncharacterized membrane protein YbhN (UPF0104 family)